MIFSFGAIFPDLLLVILLIVSLLHNVAFNTGTFYLALYYQVRARISSSERCDIIPMSQTVNVSFSNIRAGVMLLPYSLGSSLASMPVAWLLGAIQRRTHSTVGQKWVISAGLFIATTGFGEYRDSPCLPPHLLGTYSRFPQRSCGFLIEIPESSCNLFFPWRLGSASECCSTRHIKP